MSLLGNTLVITKSGQSFIQDIKIGDKILSYNFDKKKTEYNKVTDIYSYNTNLLYKMYINDSFIMCTYNHRFCVDNIKIQAQFLINGTSLVGKNNKVDITNIEKLRDIEPTVLVYDIAVKNNNDYYITSDNLLVFSNSKH